MSESIYWQDDLGLYKREEIVRCRDCVYSGDDAMYCTEGCYDESEYRNIEPDGFCKWSERRSGVYGEYIVDYRNGELYEVRERIVRCQDCIYKTRSEAWPDALDCKRTGLPTDDDLYCAWGERDVDE